jgi:hypothetical protein
MFLRRVRKAATTVGTEVLIDAGADVTANSNTGKIEAPLFKDILDSNAHVIAPNRLSGGYENLRENERIRFPASI